MSNLFEKIFKGSTRPQIIDLGNGKNALCVSPTWKVRLTDVRTEVRDSTLTTADTKSMDKQKMIRSYGAINEVLTTPMRMQTLRDQDSIEGDIIFGTFGSTLAGVHVERLIDETIRRWRLKITHPQSADISLYGERIMFITGDGNSRPFDTKLLMSRLDDESVSSVVILPWGVDRWISHFKTRSEADIYQTPLLDIDDTGIIQWLLPVYVMPLIFEFKVRPGPESILSSG